MKEVDFIGTDELYVTQGNLMKTGELSCATGYSVAHIRRQAHGRLIPATYKQPGKHFRFKKCPALYAWISRAANKKAKRQRAREKLAFLKYSKQRIRIELPVSTHLSVIKKFVAWRMRFAERVCIGELTPDQVRQLKADFAPVIEFVQQLMSGTLPEAMQNAKRGDK